MKTSALRKAAKRRANGNGNGKKKRPRINPKTGRISVGGKDVSKFKSRPKPTKEMSKHSSQMLERVDASLKAEKEGKAGKAKRLMRRAGRSNKRFIAAKEKRDNKNI